MVPTAHDQRERLPRFVQRRGVGAAEQRGEVDAVVRARAIVSGQHLQGDEMAEPGDRHAEARHRIDRVGSGHDLGLDPGRGKEQIHDGSGDIFARQGEPNGGEAARGLLLDRRDDPPAASLKVTDEGLGVAIVGNEHGEIGVTRQPGLRADRHRQAADQREPSADPLEVRDDPTERGLGAAQRRDGGQGIGRPQPSPCSAPGRVSSQTTSRASISASVASGRYRRSCARRIDSPSAHRSSAVRSRAASTSGESSATGPL